VKRSPLVRSTPMPRARSTLKATRIQPMSEKRRNEIPARAATRRNVIEQDGGCVAAELVPTIGCRGGLEVDEVQARSAGGDYLNPADCQVLCHAHHAWKTTHPTEAHALGLTRFSWEGRP
jgi:5-methylcytosine-specific restriction endonuclease McrA